MRKLTETVQSGDWKNEKHVPAIHVNKADGKLDIKVVVGEDIPHPNEMEHHIAWIKVFFQAEDAKFPVEVGSYAFTAHGEDALYSDPAVSTTVKTEKGGVVYAMSYCNIHGLWENSEEIA